MRAAPLLETERLVLRSHRVEDFDSLAAMWADPAVVRHIGDPSNAQRSWARLLSYAGLWPLLGFGYWAVQEKATGRYVGDVGFADFHRDIVPIAGIPELGWALAAPMHGRGYGAEAVRAALAWSDSQLPLSRTVCLIDPQNQASLRLAQKVGFVEFARITYMGKPTTMFERLAP